MRLRLVRYWSDGDSTSGVFCIASPQESFQACFAQEDEFRTVKVHGETRIPAGSYRVLLRKEGGFHQRYSAKFGDWHRGMLHLQDVPGFTWVLIHIGNDDDDTAGCILLGESARRNWVGSSTDAYKRLYPPIRDALLRNEEVWIDVIDADHDLRQKVAA